MFEESFKSQLVTTTTNQTLIEELWNEINQKYSKPARHYHNLSHLDHLIFELLPLKNEIEDWQTLIFSIAYHDIVFNTLKNDNEEKSAKFAMARLSRLSISESQKEKCVIQIIATKKHEISPDNDTNYFVDADLAIFGTNTDIYKKYQQQIRKEYRLYPDLVYNPGRQKVLRHFLQMQRIYKTDYFYTKYEKQARLNLESELKDLES